MKNIAIAICTLFLFSCGSASTEELSTQDDTTVVAIDVDTTSSVSVDSTLTDTSQVSM